MSINTGVMEYEIIHRIRENVIDLEGLTGTESKVMLLTRKYNLQGDRYK